MKKRRVYVYRVQYYVRTKKLYDIMILPKNGPPFTARDYHVAFMKTGIKLTDFGLCGAAWAVEGGGGNEHDLSTYRLIK